MVIRGVTVVDVQAGVNVPAQDVSIRGDRIISISASGRLPVPAGARVIQGRGRFVIPGLWDMHTHISAPPWRTDGIPVDTGDVLARTYYGGLFAAAGVTGIRDMAGDLETIRRQVTDASRIPDGVPLPRVVATAWKLGEKAVVPGAPFPIRTEADVRQSVALLKESGAALVKLEPTPPAWLVHAALRECRTQSIPCAAHVPLSVPMTQLALEGMRSLEHLFFIPENTSTIPFEELQAARQELSEPTLWQRVLYKLRLRSRPSDAWQDTAFATHSPQRAAAVFRALAESGTWVTPTLTLHDMMQHVAPPHPTARDTSLMPEPQTPPRARTPESQARAVRRWNVFNTLVRELHSAGVGLLAGTDIPLQAVPGLSLHMELELLQNAGLRPIDALRTATINPARYFGATDTLGTVAPGRVADLVLLRADPLQDVSAVNQIDLVIQRGRVYTRTQLDSFTAQARTALRTFRRISEADRKATPPGPTP